MNGPELTSTVAAAKEPETPEAQLAQLRRWLEGHIDHEGRRHPGLIEMVGRLYEELERRNERYEAIRRGVTIGTVGSLLVALLAWLKDHVKF